MYDLSLEILMAAGLLAVCLRSRWRGNPRPSLYVAAAGLAISILAAIRHLETSDIVLPAIIAVIAGTIGGLARRAPQTPKPEAE
jgi:hypothetical protein